MKYHIQNQDEVTEEVEREAAEAYMKAFDASGFRQTTGWTAPTGTDSERSRKESEKLRGDGGRGHIRAHLKKPLSSTSPATWPGSPK